MDWLRETKPKRIKDLGAYLAKAIREDYAAPAGFEGQAERAAREATARAVLDREVESRRTKAREQEERDRVQAYWEALPPERRAAFEAEALALSFLKTCMHGQVVARTGLRPCKQQNQL